jgi:hypothetical protein
MDQRLEDKTICASFSENSQGYDVYNIKDNAADAASNLKRV